jgi:quercetin dioxygenase-like cupin family protein
LRLYRKANWLIARKVFHMCDYSSKDFGETKAFVEVCVPAKLIHKSVETTHDTQFSQDRKHSVFVVDLPSKTISVTVGGLEPGQSTNRHRHTYETILYILEGAGTTFIEHTSVDWKAGDAVYIPVWAWHYHRNTCPERRCRYVACENASLLQNLGGIALREEA